MMREGIDFLDGNYELVREDKKARQIRTKSSSFASIKKNFTEFRIKLLNKKLEREKEKALTDAYSDKITVKDEEKMMKRAAGIARLEEKIKILSKEDVPSDYVDKRAIKIKNAMMENISYTAANVYSVGLENEAEVFANTDLEREKVADEVVSEVQTEIAEDVRKIMEEESAVSIEETPKYEPTAVTKAEIKAEVDQAFEEIEKHEVVEEVVENHASEELPHINLEDIKASIDEAFKEKMNESETKATIGPEEIQSVVGKSMESVNDESKISLEDIKAEIDEAMEQVVSKNGSTNAKIDRFNEDGTRREKYTYTPMTDEEIKAAQANIEYEKYEQIYKMEHEKAFEFKTARFKDIFKPAEVNFDGIDVFTKNEEFEREVPIVVPEVSGERFVSEKQTEVTSVVSRPTSLEEFSELKAKVVELKKKLAESENRKNTAIQFAARTADRAEEMKKITIASEKEYHDRLASLQLLAKTLEENCNLNDTAARTARIDAECNERFISSQMSKKNQFDEAISQVDTILGFANVEEHGRGRRAA